MTQQFKRLTAEDLDCYRELFSGINRKFQQFGYSDLYLFDVKKATHILKIYREWLLSQDNPDFSELYQTFWNLCEMKITAVSLLLLPRRHNKKQEIEHIDQVIAAIDEAGTSFIFNDVQSNAVGFAVKNTIYPALRDSLKEIRISAQEENVEYCQKIDAYLASHPEFYPDPDNLVSFFDSKNADLPN